MTWELIPDCETCGGRCARHTDGRLLCDESELGEMLDGYLSCALWSSTDESNDSGGDPLDDNYGPDDIDDAAWLSALGDCDDFLASNERDCKRAMGKRYGNGAAYDYEMVGHDLWLTRNGHGAGFWDRGFGALGERLSKASKPYGSCYLTVDESGRIHGF